MELEVHSVTKGAVGGTVSVAERIFAAAFNEPLVHQVLTAYLAGGRSGSKAQKSRAEVRGGGAKPWRQKGMGRARAGSTRNPLWRGGGASFAAKPRNYAQKVNRKMYRGAIRSIFSELLRRKRVMVLDSFDVASLKTRELIKLLGNLNLRSALVVVEQLTEELALAARNLHYVEVCEVPEINPALLLRHENVLITENALKLLEGRLA